MPSCSSFRCSRVPIPSAVSRMLSRRHPMGLPLTMWSRPTLEVVPATDLIATRCAHTLHPESTGFPINVSLTGIANSTRYQVLQPALAQLSTRSIIPGADRKLMTYAQLLFSITDILEGNTGGANPLLCPIPDFPSQQAICLSN